MLTRLIKMPKIKAKSGEIIDATTCTSPVDKMNPDSSLPIHCIFFVKSRFGRQKQTQPFFSDAFR